MNEGKWNDRHPPSLSVFSDDSDKHSFVSNAEEKMYVPTRENCLEMKSTPFLILLSIGLGG
jgi:hypothetical protein